ncbi:MAG: cob(I)yrinic acid a,c-diamide adenosyltransferase [Verrucomicrobiota bacterium]
MSIATKTGDAGSTALMYNRRVPKTHPRVEAYGCVDELNAALGVARAHAPGAIISERLLAVQKDLVPLMGELATLTDDLDRYVKAGLPRIDPSATAVLDGWVRDLESQKISFDGWATPGANPLAAALDLARTVCRRAERRVCSLQEQSELRNPEIIVYLNRLSDVLWLLARAAEGPPNLGSALA